MLLLPLDFWRAWRIQESRFLHQHSTLVKTELLLKQTNKQNHTTTNTKKAKKQPSLSFIFTLNSTNRQKEQFSWQISSTRATSMQLVIYIQLWVSSCWPHSHYHPQSPKWPQEVWGKELMWKSKDITRPQMDIMTPTWHSEKHCTSCLHSPFPSRNVIFLFSIVILAFCKQVALQIESSCCLPQSFNLFRCECKSASSFHTLF